MRHYLPPLAAPVLLLVCLHDNPATAGVVVTINKATQRMTVAIDGEARYSWPVSTGTKGYATPSGAFRPFRLERSITRESGTMPRCRTRSSLRRRAMRSTAPTPSGDWAHRLHTAASALRPRTRYSTWFNRRASTARRLLLLALKGAWQSEGQTRYDALAFANRQITTHRVTSRPITNIPRAGDHVTAPRHCRGSLMRAGENVAEASEWRPISCSRTSPRELQIAA